MSLSFQVQGQGTLHAALIEAAAGATGGSAAFAFATSMGIDTCFAEPALRKVLARALSA